MSPRTYKQSVSQDASIADEILASATPTDDHGASRVVVGVVGPGRPFDLGAMLSLRGQFSLQHVQSFGDQRVNVVVTRAETAPGSYAPARPQRSPIKRRTSGKRALLLTVAAAMTCAALWASWRMVVDSLPLDATLLLRTASAKLSHARH
jgi:hypothetical protein